MVAMVGVDSSSITNALTAQMGGLSQWLCHEDSTINIIQVLLLTYHYYQAFFQKGLQQNLWRMYESEFYKPDAFVKYAHSMTNIQWTVP